MLSQDMILNKVLSTKDMSIITLNDLTADMFFKYKAEFLFLINHYKTYGNVPDKVVFAEAFPDFIFYDVSEPNNFLLEKLYGDYNESLMIANYNAVRNLIINGKSDEALKLYISGVDKVNRSGSAFSTVDIISNTSRYDRYIERTTNKQNFYLSTGFPEIDKHIGGIDRKNENFVVAGRTGCGKSQTILKMAAEASKQGLTVGIYEGEMSEDKVAYRIDTFLGNVSNTALNRGDLFIKQEYQNFINCLSTAGYGPIKVLTPQSAGGRVTVDTLRAFIEKDKLDILFVDQYSLLEDTSHAKTSFERVGNIAKEIKQLQTKYEIPIVSVAQMNRTKNEDGSQDTTQIGLSDLIPQYATILIMLDRDKDDKTKFIMNIIKARDGGDGQQLVYNVDWDKGKFKYIPSEDDGVTDDDFYEEIANKYASGDPTRFEQYNF